MRKKIYALVLLLVVSSVDAAEPETVMVTYRPSPGNDAKLEQVIRDHWATATKLGLVDIDNPHVLIRNGKTYVEIFTWKDGDIPDNAPPEILKIWGEMSKVTEKKDGIRIDQVTMVK